MSSWTKWLYHGVIATGTFALLLAPAAVSAQSLPDPMINEFVADHTGGDTHEFIEVTGEPGADYSGFTVLEIEGDGTGTGVVDGIFPVGNMGGGYWTTGFLAGELENGTMTLLLVEGYFGFIGEDLDIDDDGVLDIVSWVRLVDDVAVTDGDPGDLTYSLATLSPGYDGITYDVGGASRIPDGMDTDSDSDWMRNDYDGEGLPGFLGTPVGGEAVNTPGAMNMAVTPPRDPVINEFVANHFGIDTEEFVEVFGDPGTNYGGFAIVQIDGDETIAGAIDSYYPVGVTSGGGFWTT